MPLLNEPHVKVVVGGLVAHIGFKSRITAQGHRPAAGDRPLRFHDPRVVSQRAQRLLRRTRVDVARSSQVQGVFAQVFLLKFSGTRAGITRIFHVDDQVEIAGEQSRYGGISLHLGDVDAQEGMGVAEKRQCRRDESQRAAVWKEASMRMVPTRSVKEVAMSGPPRPAPARSSTASVWATRISACGVRRTRRPTCSRRGTPASDSKRASCWEIVEGLYDRAEATAASVPRCLSSRSRRSRCRSNIKTSRTVVFLEEYCSKTCAGTMGYPSAQWSRAAEPTTVPCTACRGSRSQGCIVPHFLIGRTDRPWRPRGTTIRL